MSRDNEYYKSKSAAIRIARLKKVLPHIEFTETGLKNLCNRFNITREELDSNLKSINHTPNNSHHGR